MLRLIAFIVVSVIFLFFIVFNLGPENQSDISFGFKTFTNIPVFLTVFSSFLLGMLFAVFFVISFGRKRKKPLQTESGSASQKPKKRWGKKNKDPQGAITDGNGSSGAAVNPVSDEMKKENGIYGID